ncbi:tetraacyldisaccharide 4'-kinase [Pelobium manganitolerans]|uniref:tetraacyldisaccharide 4'-kinase n=1 Tax=Pelobium manganitolerans TaxID=1842495 RepID=UPI003FA36899
MLQVLRQLLLPFSLVYGLIVFIRNKFYDWGWFKSYSFNLPIISVGNLEVGGSGKTPMVEYLIKLLKNDHKLATLSRGYGRKTKGFLWVKPNDDASNTGDEPLQMAQKFKNIGVAVCENRVAGIKKIRQTHNLILMDDAYQHRAVKPGLSLLLFNYHQINKPRFLLPAGNYRETFSGRKRAQVLIASKCPQNLSAEERQSIKNILAPYPHQKLFFSALAYASSLKNVFTAEKLPKELITDDWHVLLLTGIAKPEPLYQNVLSYTPKIAHHRYADHHQFSDKNIRKLVEAFDAIASDKKIIITTEKDAVRLKTDKFAELRALHVYQWPIEVVFLFNEGEAFNHLIKEYAEIN